VAQDEPVTKRRRLSPALEQARELLFPALSLEEGRVRIEAIVDAADDDRRERIEQAAARPDLFADLITELRRLQTEVAQWPYRITGTSRLLFARHQLAPGESVLDPDGRRMVVDVVLSHPTRDGAAGEVRLRPPQPFRTPSSWPGWL
jgi:hypothetical protein